MLKYLILLVTLLPNIAFSYSSSVNSSPYDDSPYWEVIAWLYDNNRELDELNTNHQLSELAQEFARTDFYQDIQTKSPDYITTNPEHLRLLKSSMRGIFCATAHPRLDWKDKLFSSNRYEEAKEFAHKCANKYAKKEYLVTERTKDVTGLKGWIVNQSEYTSYRSYTHEERMNEAKKGYKEMFDHIMSGD